MLLDGLKKLGERYNDYMPAIAPLTAYLTELNSKNIHIIQPEILSRRLNIPYGIALHILSLAEKDHLVKRSYQVYSADDNRPIGEYDDTQDIPRKIYNPATEQYVDRDNYFVDLVFHFAGE